MLVVLEDICMLTAQYHGLVIDLDNGTATIGRNKGGSNCLIYTPHSIRPSSKWFPLKVEYQKCGSVEELKIHLDVIGKDLSFHVPSKHT